MHPHPSPTLAPHTPASHFSFLFTLLLTLVAFEYTVQDMLPNVHYATLLEIYTLASTGALFIVALWSGIVLQVCVWWCCRCEK
jgi:hypothetical protein